MANPFSYLPVRATLPFSYCTMLCLLPEKLE